MEDARHVEEDHGLLEPTFKSGAWAFLYWNGPSFYEWLMSLSDAVKASAIGEYAIMANILMIGHSTKTWLAKAPIEAPLLPAITSVFPDARIVHTHRDPTERIPSTASLMLTFQSMYTNPDHTQLGRQVLDYNRYSQEGIAQARSGPTGEKAVDVQFRELIENPVSVATDVLVKSGHPPTETDLKSMEDWLSKNQYDPRRVGQHKYCAADFGLDEKSLAMLDP